MAGVAPAPAQEQAMPPHSATTIPSFARHDIIQSQLTAKWIFRLDRFCGSVSQLVKTADDHVSWETLRLRNASFLKFLISGATDIDKFLETKTNRPA
jgi:hypothetical protein